MLQKLRMYMEMVRFSHTLFAMPFALASMLWAADGLPSLKTFLLIILAMVFCRNAAMSFNRYVDAKIDALNPRTEKRHIPAGRLSKSSVLGFLIFNLAGFIVTCYFINTLALILAVPTLLVTLGYSITKRFFHGTHFVLGLALAIAPLGAWIAVRSTLNEMPFWIAAIVLTWVSGFDIIYATQDVQFDRKAGLHSVVVWLGEAGAIKMSKWLHIVCSILIMIIGIRFHLGRGYSAAAGIAVALLAYVHFFRKSNSLDQMNQDFFWANVGVGFCVLAGSVLSVGW